MSQKFFYLSFIGLLLFASMSVSASFVERDVILYRDGSESVVFVDSVDFAAVASAKSVDLSYNKTRRLAFVYAYIPDQAGGLLSLREHLLSPGYSQSLVNAVNRRTMESTYGKLAFELSKEFGPVAITNDLIYDESGRINFRMVLRQIESDLDADFSQYQHVMLFFPFLNTEISGLASIGGSLSAVDSLIAQSWTREQDWIVSVVAHELGHNLNLHHSGINGLGEYLDPYSIMGGMSHSEEKFNALKLFSLNAYEADDVIVLKESQRVKLVDLYSMRSRKAHKAVLIPHAENELYSLSLASFDDEPRIMLHHTSDLLDDLSSSYTGISSLAWNQNAEDTSNTYILEESFLRQGQLPFVLQDFVYKAQTLEFDIIFRNQPSAKNYFDLQNYELQIFNTLRNCRIPKGQSECQLRKGLGLAFYGIPSGYSVKVWTRSGDHYQEFCMSGVSLNYPLLFKIPLVFRPHFYTSVRSSVYEDSICKGDPLTENAWQMNLQSPEPGRCETGAIILSNPLGDTFCSP